MRSTLKRFIRSVLGLARDIAIVFSLTLVTTLALTTPTQAAIWYVDQDSIASSPDGTTWALAFKFIPQALTEAAPDDEIWVAEGTYRPDESTANPTGSGDKTLSFALKVDVAVYGGFDGTETSRDQRDPQLSNPTYLSGDLDGDDDYTTTGFLDDPPDYSSMSDNSYHVVEAISIPASGQDPEILIDPDTWLDGFIIRGGNAVGSTDTHKRGGGMYCGAATYNTNLKSSPTVANNRFEFNHVETYAAALYTSYGDAVLRDLCVFENNHSDDCGGAVTLEFDGDVTILASHFIDNQAAGRGGAVQNGVLSNTTTIHSCQFISNRVTSSSGKGGAVFLNGDQADLLNCEFRDNTAANEGGGARLNTATVTNCTFSGNETTQAGESRPGGGGIWAGGTVTIKNTILWDNTSNYGTTLQQQIHGGGSYTATYSDIETGGSPVSGTGNIEDDPMFRGTTNLGLTSCSPCIDVGNGSSFPADVHDIDNDEDEEEPTPDGSVYDRILNGDDTSGAVIDMGAFEYDPACFADLYGEDGEVDGQDLAVLLAAWTGETVGSPCPDEDFNDDCKVNGFDLAILLGVWGTCTGVCEESFVGGGSGSPDDDEDLQQLIAWFIAGDMDAIIQWLIEQGY